MILKEQANCVDCGILLRLGDMAQKRFRKVYCYSCFVESLHQRNERERTKFFFFLKRFLFRFVCLIAAGIVMEYLKPYEIVYSWQLVIFGLIVSIPNFKILLKVALAGPSWDLFSYDFSATEYTQEITTYSSGFSEVTYDSRDSGCFISLVLIFLRWGIKYFLIVSILIPALALASVFIYMPFQLVGMIYLMIARVIRSIQIRSYSKYV